MHTGIGQWEKTWQKEKTSKHFISPDGKLYHPLIKCSWGKRPESDQVSLAPTTNLQEREEYVKRCSRDIISKIQKVENFVE